MTEVQARSAFNTAQTKLDAALTEYKQAAAALHHITGQVHAVPGTTAMKFSQLMGDAPVAAKADC